MIKFIVSYVNICSSSSVIFLMISLFSISIDMCSLFDKTIWLFNLHSYGASEFKFLLIYLHNKNQLRIVSS